MDERNSAAERASGRNERGRKQIPGLHSSAADVSGVGCAECRKIALKTEFTAIFTGGGRKVSEFFVSL